MFILLGIILILQIRKYISKPPRSQNKTVNLRKNTKLYFCIDDPNPPYKGVKGRGICRIHYDINYNIPIAEKIMTIYLGSMQHPMAQKLMSFVKNGDSVIIEIKPIYFNLGL